MAAQQAPPSLGFSRQEYWSGLPFPSPGDFPNPGIEPRSLVDILGISELKWTGMGKLYLYNGTIISMTVGENPLEEME